MGLVYLDTSVLLAQLLAEDVEPPAALWEEPLVASRLLEYETWTRLHGRGLAESHGDDARHLLARVATVELAEPLARRAGEPFPRPVRTLDALHLAALEFLRDQGQEVRLATYDRRMGEAAEAMGVERYRLPTPPAP